MEKEDIDICKTHGHRFSKPAWRQSRGHGTITVIPCNNCLAVVVKQKLYANDGSDDFSETSTTVEPNTTNIR